MPESHRSTDGLISRRGLLIVGGGALAAALAACSTGGSATHQASVAPALAVPQARVTFEPPAETANFDPVGTVMVSVIDGTLEEVVMTNSDGRVIPGVVTPDKLAWKPDTPLGYSKTYTFQATTRDGLGRIRSATSTFRTVEPNNLTMPSFVTTGGGALRDGGTYGVGMVTVVHFDEPITDRAAAQRALSVQTEPAVEGQWNWVDDQNVHWRPREYYRPGTKVTARANVYAKDLGNGLYGQDDVACSFSIGDSHVSIADDTTKQVSVYVNDELVRTMPTSMGRGGTETVNGRTIHFWTQSGTYTVLDKANPVIMDSSTYGLPVNSRLGYRETINWATRISNDGIYLHQLEDTIPQQGNTNMSSGCLNLNPDNARWFFDFAVTGDVVEVRNTGGPPLELWQNGDWGVPWETWVAGSAL